MKLNIDHFNITLGDEVFEEMKNILSLFAVSRHSHVEMGHTKLEGIYIIPFEGCLVEFTKNDEERKTQALKLYTVSSNGCNLFKALPKKYPNKQWKTDQRYYSDKTEYFKSTKPSCNTDYLFFSGFDYSDVATKKRSLMGKENNNCKRVSSLKITVGENLYREIDDRIFMFDKIERNEDGCAFRIDNNGEDFILRIGMTKGDIQDITITFDVLEKIDAYESSHINGYCNSDEYVLCIFNK